MPPEFKGHTPTPWVAVPQSDGSAMIAHEYETGKQMNPKGLRLICHVMSRGNSLRQDEANAELIVRAVNASASNEKVIEALVEALEGLMLAVPDGVYMEWSATEEEMYKTALAAACSALDKAKGTP